MSLPAEPGADSPTAPPRRGWPARAWPWLAALLVAFLAGEVAARLDDRLFSDTPILANPDRGRDLLVNETWGVRGRPNGAYRRWQLNSHGFSGPEISGEPQGRRLMILGASETFGLYESKGKDYPAQLAGELKQRGHRNIEVVNAAVAGMTLPSLTVYWEQWASRFNPTTVVVYPSAHFYLDTDLPKAPPLLDTPPLPQVTDLPTRFGMRLRDQFRQIPLLRSIRARMIVGAALKSQPADFTFIASPAARVAEFAAAVERLGQSIEIRGARPILVTHAFKFPRTLTRADRAELENFRVFFPRATPDAFTAFSADAREAVIAVGKKRGWPVIDAAAELTGRRELYADPVHFTNEGSRLMARILADALPTLLAPASASRTGER